MEARPLSRCAALVLALVASGCRGGGLYDWGPYESSVHALCTDFEQSDPVAELARLDEHVSKLAERDRVPAPGVHAQLGYLEYMVGNTGAAVRHFEAEKILYPESTVFMDGLLRRMEAE